MTAESVEEDWQQRRLQRRGGKGGWRGAGKWQPRRVEGSGQVAVKEVESISKIVLFFFLNFGHLRGLCSSQNNNMCLLIAEN